MLFTIWLVLGALSFAAIMEDAGFLARLIQPVLARAHSTGRLIAAVICTSIGLNVVAGDQYVAIVMPSRIYRAEFAKRGIAPRMLSRAVEDSGTVTSPLIPWNSCGAYMAGVLGVATFSYLPYCFFNIASPIISLLYGFTGFRIEHVPPADDPGARRACHPPATLETPVVRGRSRMTAAADRVAGPGRRAPVRPAVGLHDPVRPDRDHGGADVRGSSRPACTTSTPTASRSRAPTTGSTRTPQRIIVDSLLAPINGLYGIEGEDGIDQRLEQRRAVRRDRRRAVHPRDRRLPRA